MTAILVAGSAALAAEPAKGKNAPPALRFKPQAGKDYKADLGAVFSDTTGTNRAARVYWSNKATGLVNDVPGETMGSPKLWGTARIAP